MKKTMLTVKTLNRFEREYITDTYTTGSRRGYIRVTNRGIETAPQPIPADLAGLRGNIRRALDYLQRRGCTHYTVCDWQGVPSKGYSNQYCYSMYTGYTA